MLRNAINRFKSLLTAVSTHSPARTPVRTPVIITVRAFPQYGRTVYYPTCPQAKRFAAIAGTKTLTPHTISQIKALGYLVYSESEPDPIHDRFL